MSPWKIPFFDSDIGEEEIAAVNRVLESRWLTMGEVTKKLEQQFSEFCGSKHVFAVANGTAALHLANLVLDIGPGDEVIVPSLTFVASVNSILYTGAKAVFADITSEHDLNISPDDIERKITPRTKAILAVHYAGYPCNMERITEIVRKNNLYLIEDAAHAPGAHIYGKSCGTFGHCGCFSFFSNKNLATGEGGMIVTGNDQLADKIRLLRSHGMTTLTLERYKGHAYSYDVVELGYNYRTAEINAAMGIVQLKKLTAKNKRRELLVKLYNSKFADVEDVTVPFVHHQGQPSYHIYPILLKKGVNRIEFMKYLKEQGIQTSIHYPPVHLFSYHRKLYENDLSLPITEDVASREVTLPLYPAMTEEDVNTVVEVTKEALMKL